MDMAGQRVRRHVRAERELRGWNQIELAREAGVSRGTVQRLEDGVHLSEGKESKIEAALGWEVGSLDSIRADGKPIPADSGAGKPLGQWLPDEAWEHSASMSEKEGDEFILRWKRARQRYLRGRDSDEIKS